MHFKRRRRRAGRVVLFVLAAVLLAALGTGMWLLWPRAMAPGYAQCGGAPGHAAGAAALVELSNGCGRALLRRAGGSGYAVRRRGRAYAQAHGLNALFLDVADAELSSIAFRDRRL